MLSADTNLLIHAADPDSPNHSEARQFFTEVRHSDEEFVLCELVLVELYMQLRNPAVFKKPYSAKEAATYCTALKQIPVWRCVDYDSAIAEKLWHWAMTTSAGFRQITDARIALTLRHHGVKRFATANVRHFNSFGFTKVWNPLEQR